MFDKQAFEKQPSSYRLPAVATWRQQKFQGYTALYGAKRPDISREVAMGPNAMTLYEPLVTGKAPSSRPDVHINKINSLAEFC